MSQVSYGTITITDTNDIESITVEYNRNQSSSSAPSATDSGWSTTRPNWAQGYYIWQRTRVHKSGTTADKDVIGTAVCITGSTGSTGAPGRGLTDTTTQYCNYGTGTPADNYSGWTDAPPSYDSSKPNYWVMITNTYSAAPTPEIIKYKDEALTKAVADAAIANSIAQHANEDAQGAMSQSANGIASIYRVWYRTNTTTAPSKPPAHVTSEADDVNNTWTTVKPKENADNRYYFYCEETVTNGGVSSWTNPVLDTSNLSQYEIGALTTKVKNFWWNSDGAHIASGINGADVDKNSPVSAYGFNSLVGLTGISFGYNNAKVIDLNTTPSPTSLKFYQPPTISGSTVTQGALAMELSSNALKFYGSSTSTPDASLSSTGLNLAKGSITLGDYFSVTNTGVLTAKSGTIGGWSFTDAALYYSNATPGYSTTNLVISKSSAVNTNAIAGSETNKHWFLAAGRKFGVDTEGNLYANNAHLSSATVEGAIIATQLTISGGGATYDGASAINANGYTIEIIDDKTAAPTGSVITENQTYLYPVMYLNGVAVTTGITKTNYIWYTNENTATTGGVAGDSTNGGIIATYGNTYRVTYDLSDDAVGTTPSQSTIHTSDARHITDISSSGITIHPEDGTAGNYMQLDSDGLKIYKSSTLLANYGTTVTIGSSSAKNVYIDSNGVQIRDSATSLAEFGTTARIGQNGSSRFLMNSDSLQAYDNDNNLYFEVSSSGLNWVDKYITTVGNDGIRIHPANSENNSVVINSNGMEIFKDGTSATNSIAFYGETTRIGNSNNNNLIIDPTTGVSIRRGSTELAQFTQNSISLAPKNGSASISMCKKAFEIQADYYYDNLVPGYVARATLQNNSPNYQGHDILISGTTTDGGSTGQVSIVTKSRDNYPSIKMTTSSLFESDSNNYSYENYIETAYHSVILGSSYKNTTSSVSKSSRIDLWASVSNSIITLTAETITSSVAIQVTSDRKSKQHKKYINEEADCFIRNLKPAFYIKDNQKHTGFYAQDVEEIDPWNCMTGEMNGFKTLGYTEIIAPLVAYCQHLEKRINDLESQNRGGKE